MWDIVRDSSFGQCLRIMSSRRLAKYPEERANFELPAGYLESCSRLALRSPIIESNVDPETVPQEKDDLAGATVIGWYSDIDPENPRNWSSGKKLWIATMLFVYTFSVYIGSSLYTASESDVRTVFGVSDTVASLGLTLYVVH